MIDRLRNHRSDSIAVGGSHASNIHDEHDVGIILTHGTSSLPRMSPDRADQSPADTPKSTTWLQLNDGVDMDGEEHIQLPSADDARESHLGGTGGVSGSGRSRLGSATSQFEDNGEASGSMPVGAGAGAGRVASPHGYSPPLDADVGFRRGSAVSTLGSSFMPGPGFDREKGTNAPTEAHHEDLPTAHADARANANARIRSGAKRNATIGSTADLKHHEKAHVGP